MRSEACGCPKVRFADLRAPAGGPRPGPSGHDDPCVEQGRRTIPEGLPDNGEHRPGPEIATVERREARRSRFSSLELVENVGRRKHGARVPVTSAFMRVLNA